MYGNVNNKTGKFPEWLKKELRTDHAGEYAAVVIYEGALVGLKLRYLYIYIYIY